MCKDPKYSPKRQEELLVLRKRKINEDYFVLDLKVENGLPKCFPGQFTEVLVNNAASTFLRRPISIYDVDYENNIMSLLILIAGEGTRIMSELKEGDYLNNVYPLGKSFSVLEKGKKALLVGGGVGVAPMYFQAKALKDAGVEPIMILGGRSANYIIEQDRFKELGSVYITTDDGTLGEKALVTQHSALPRLLEEVDRVYTCGPDPMMRAVAKVAAEAKVECEASLENLMACGIGACLCCVEDTVDGHRVVCTDGPVFNTKVLKW